MNNRILYFDCFSGIAGDMTLGALIDLGVDATALEAALRSLPIEEDWTLRVGEARKSGLRAVDVHVEIGGRIEQQGDARSFVPEAGHHKHVHAAYHYADIVRIIEGGALPEPVTARARAAFEVVAQAEAKVHGADVEAVHFHEVGAVDSIIDIVGSAWGIWQLGVDQIISAPPPLGRGFVKCAHGRMPAPAPATLEILRGLPVRGCPLDRELVTPTGAAFVKAWAASVGDFPPMTVEGIGFGAGDADFPDRPNLLRLVLGRSDPADAACTVIEANIDDMTPELAGYLMERLFQAGARDAWFVPIHMKKNRPALIVGALCDTPRHAQIEAILLSESSAIGLRRFPVSRVVLDRRSVEVETAFGPVSMKIASRDGRTVNAAPEYETCARVARARGVALKTVYQHAVAAWLRREEDDR